jgi:hypothetical protein
MAFHDEERIHHQRGFDFEQAQRETYCTLAPSQTILTASPRTDCNEGSYQRGEQGEQLHLDDDARSTQPRPPVEEVRIPLSAVVRQGLVELSREEWKSLYLTTSKNLEVARAHVYQTSHENRQLKRRLIEMQKSLFESRRNRSQLLPSVPDQRTMSPWSIPDSRRSVGGKSPGAAAAATTTTTRTATAPLVVATSTASEEDDSNDDDGAFLAPPPKKPLEAVLLPRPSKVQRRGSSLTASTGASAACSEAS